MTEIDDGDRDEVEYVDDGDSDETAPAETDERYLPEDDVDQDDTDTAEDDPE